MKTLCLILLPFFFINSAIADDSYLDGIKREFLKNECLQNLRFVVQRRYKSTCEKNYHHYNSEASNRYYSTLKAQSHGKVRISEFNLLHPGMSKTRFKNYKLIAKMINKFDVVGATELLPLVSRDLRHNINIQTFLSTGPSEIIETEKKLKVLESRPRTSTRRSFIILLKRKITKLKKDLLKAASLYRPPGYLKILEELRKLPDGDQWSLILTPRGEGAKTSPTHELIGYYYRAMIVRPIRSKYCHKVRTRGLNPPYACIVNMDEKDFTEDKSQVFSRRPFLAKFESGKFIFSLLSSHVIFDSPDEEKRMQEILNKSFNVSSYELLGRGINKENYARFAEVKTTLDFINKNLNEEQNVIYMGDMNLEHQNPFWKKALTSWPGANLYITKKTSVTTRKIKDGNETHGLSSNYDHFILNKEKTPKCFDTKGKFNGSHYNFITNEFTPLIKQSYLIRTQRRRNDSERYIRNNSLYYKAIRKFSTPYRKYGKKRMYTISKVKMKYKGANITTTGIVPDSKENKKQADLFSKRVLNTQLFEKSYYDFFKQTISDHLPIYMDCRTN